MYSEIQCMSNSVLEHLIPFSARTVFDVLHEDAHKNEIANVQRSHVPHLRSMSSSMSGFGRRESGRTI